MPSVHHSTKANNISSHNGTKMIHKTVKDSVLSLQAWNSHRKHIPGLCICICSCCFNLVLRNINKLTYPTGGALRLLLLVGLEDA